MWLVILLLLCACSSLSEILISGTSHIEIGYKLQITCNATMGDFASGDIVWFKDGYKIVTSEETQILITKYVSFEDQMIFSVLEKQNSKLKDAGTYVCRSSNNEIASIKVHVLRAPDPVLDRSPLNVTSTKDETAILPCTVTNKGSKFKVAWMFERTVIAIETARTIDDPRLSIGKPTDDSWYLHISNVTQRYQGRYECIVNTRPVQRKVVILKVLVPPYIIYSTPDIDVLEGRNAELMCTAGGDPTPEILWNTRLDGQTLVVGYGSSYTVEGVNRNHSDTFTCEASNGVTPNAMSSIKINVVYPPEMHTITESMGKYFTNDTRICCNVTSNPEPQIHWQKNGVNILDDERHQNTFSNDTEFYFNLCLEISTIDVNDFGIYTCLATNPYGSTDTTMELYPLNIAPIIHAKSERVGKMQGTYAMLECTVTAYPSAVLKFKKWNREVEASDRYSIEMFEENSTSQIMTLNIASLEPDDFSVYTCEAQNREGLATAEIELYEIGDPVFDTTPITISANLGSPAILPCSVIDLGSNNVMWMGPSQNPISIGQILKTTDSRITLQRPYQNEWNLQISNVKLTDAGEYTCVISTQPVQKKAITLIIPDAGEYTCVISTQPVQKKAITLIIPEPPHIIDESSPRTMTTTLGSNVQLECYAAGEPLPRINWYKVIGSTSGRDEGLADLEAHESVLPFPAISKDEAGTYVCQASNGVPPIAEKKFSIIVNYPPTITLKPESAGEYVGRTITIQCSVEGSPLPRVIWTREGRRIENNWKYNTQFFQDSDFIYVSTLSVTSLELEDFGDYSCESYNDQGQVTKSANLYPLGTPKILVNDSSKDKRITEGDNLGLKCSAEGFPKPTVKWYKVANDSGNVTKEELGGYMVEIQGIDQSHNGIYECIASNVIANTSMQITVQVDVKLQVHLENRKVGCRIGDEVIIECIVRGSPEPIMLWKKSNSINVTWEHIIEVHLHNETMRTILMKIKSLEAEDFGEYMCFAENMHSRTSKSIHLYNLETTTLTAEQIKEKTTKHSKTTTQEAGAARGKNGGISTVRTQCSMLLYIAIVLSTFHKFIT